MPRKGQRLKTRKPAAVKPPGPPRRPDDPLIRHPLMRYVNLHFDWMLTHGYSADTVRARRVALRRFVAWCAERSLDDPCAFTKPILERYQKHLFYYRKADGQPLTLGAQLGYLAPLKTFFKWLSRENHILYNPASELVLPKQPKRLPRSLLSVAEVDAILNQADATNPQGLRDRAMLELLYSTGLRRMGAAAAFALRRGADTAPGLRARRQGRTRSRGAAGRAGRGLARQIPGRRASAAAVRAERSLGSRVKCNTI